MPNSKSAAKRHRQSLVRRARNRAKESTIKTQLRKVRAMISAGQIKEAETEFRQVAKTVDQVAASGVIHANAAARLKSRLSAAIKTAKGKNK
jgi:small subunit ribosomal protein S20